MVLPQLLSKPSSAPLTIVDWWKLAHTRKVSLKLSPKSIRRPIASELFIYDLGDSISAQILSVHEVITSWTDKQKEHLLPIKMTLCVRMRNNAQEGVKLPIR